MSSMRSNHYSTLSNTGLPSRGLFVPGALGWGKGKELTGQLPGKVGDSAGQRPCGGCQYLVCLRS